MNKTYLLALVATLVTAPLAFAHVNGDPYGIPKRYCEDVKGDKVYHDYGPSTGFIIFLGNDGSLDECPYSAGTENPTFDGHFEHAFGGAWLVSGTNAAAAAACGWPYPDHPAFPTIWVFDHVLSEVPADVAFSVYADTLNNIPPVDPNEPNCGDFESDYGVDCVNHCTVGFPPGLDQTYQVYVNGVAGHVWTTGGGPGLGCIDFAHPYSLPPPDAIRRKNPCQGIEVTNAGPNAAELVFYGVAPYVCNAPVGVTVCPWLGNELAYIQSGTGASAGTFRQV